MYGTQCDCQLLLLGHCLIPAGNWHPLHLVKQGISWGTARFSTTSFFAHAPLILWEHFNFHISCAGPGNSWASAPAGTLLLGTLLSWVLTAQIKATCSGLPRPWLISARLLRIHVTNGAACHMAVCWCCGPVCCWRADVQVWINDTEEGRCWKRP